MTNRLRLVFAGTPAVAVPALTELIGSAHEVVAVVTRPDARSGRGRALQPSPVRQVAEAHGIEVLTPPKAGDESFVERLRDLAPDCCPVVAYGALLPQRVLDIPRFGWVNLHFSVLPAWRGAAPVQHAIWRGDTETGASVFRIVKELDAGPVYAQLVEALSSRDTAGDVLDRLAVSGAQLLGSTIDAIADGSVRAHPQMPDGVSYAPKISVDDARVVWTHPAFAVDRQIRACTPDPGAWTTFRGARLKLEPVRLADEGDIAPGELRVERSRILVGAASGAVELTNVKADGKKVMPAADWARGARPEPGEKLV